MQWLLWVYAWRHDPTRGPHPARRRAARRAGPPVPLADHGRPQGRRPVDGVHARRAHRSGRRQREPPPQGARRGRPGRGGARAGPRPPRALVAPGRRRHPLESRATSPTTGRGHGGRGGRGARPCGASWSASASGSPTPTADPEWDDGAVRDPELAAAHPRRARARSPTRSSTCSLRWGDREVPDDGVTASRCSSSPAASRASHDDARPHRVARRSPTGRATATSACSGSARASACSGDDHPVVCSRCSPSSASTPARVDGRAHRRGLAAVARHRPARPAPGWTGSTRAGS